MIKIYDPLSFIFSFVHDHNQIDLFILFAHDYSIKIHGSLSFLFFVHDHSTKNQGLHWFISLFWTRPFDQNIWSFFQLFFLLRTAFRSKIRGLIYLYLLFVLDYSIKIRGHSYSLIYSCLNCTNILYAIFIVVLPLFFVRYI